MKTKKQVRIKGQNGVQENTKKKYPGKGKIFLSSPIRPDRLWAQLALNLVFSAYGIAFLGLKRPGIEVQHAPLSAEAKHDYSHISAPSIRLNCVDRENFTFTMTCGARFAAPAVASCDTLLGSRVGLRYATCAVVKRTGQTN